MADAGRMIALLGVVGVGGYVVWQYTEYQHALNIIDQADPTGATSSQIQAGLPFMSYLMAGFSAPSQGTPAYTFYALLHAALSGALTGATSATPGTSASTSQPLTTTVSTAPTTTPVTTGSTAPATTTVTPATPTTPQPTAADLQHALNATLASPDQWNFAYRELTGYGIESIYGGNFDAIYGPIQANGSRPTGNITAQAFLNLPAARGLSASGLSGFGAIARFYTPVVNPMSSLVYRAQHPSPYRLPVSGGMSGLTQATGFEKALWAGGFIRSRRIR